MNISPTGRDRPLGTGRMYAAGSVRDSELATILASYKRDVAGAYTSISPDAIDTSIPSGRHIASTKIDGEQWFLCKSNSGTLLVSPNCKVITGIPITEEVDRILSGWSGVLAGELYAAVDTGHPRVFDLHAAMGGGLDAQVDRLRFTVFDILRDGDGDCQSMEFNDRTNRIRELLGDAKLVHPSDFTCIDGTIEVERFFESRTRSGEEGIVVRCDDGRIFKIKPKITIDAVVVAYTETVSGIGELLLGLITETHPDSMQIIGRVDIGFSVSERRQIADRLNPLNCESTLNLSSRSGLPYKWVRPVMVVEVTCHELLSSNSGGEPIRRWRVIYDNDIWKPLGKADSISMRDTVFMRVREDKAAVLPDVRWSQVTDLIPVSDITPDICDRPKSEVICRQVYTKAVRRYGIAVRKIVVWKTNKEETDSRYPAYAVMFTDYSPARQEPMRTELRVASRIEHIMVIAENWLAENVKRGWECVSKTGDVISGLDKPITTTYSNAGSHTLMIAFARSTSPTFPIVRRRLDALAELGSLNITTEDSGKEVWFELHIHGGLVENYRRITNLLSLVRRWKSIEVGLDGESLDKYGIDDVLNRIEEIRQCWNRRKAGGTAGCLRDCAVGCRNLRITPSQRFLEGAFITEPPWYTVGRFENGHVVVDKAALLTQVDRRRNKLLDCCPCFDKNAILSAVGSLPDTLSPDDPGYRIAYRRDDGLAAWVWPEHAPMPARLGERGAQVRNPQAGSEVTGLAIHAGHPTLPQSRHIPPATYADICGQDEAVEAVRDMIELPMRHAHLFEAVGVSPRPGGIILAGPPGTGKTLLARAVAGECGAHLEVVSGPELLSPYVGATEQALRDVFERAAKHAPSIILFDEIDSIAPSRSTADAHHQQSMVAQLLTLLDGLESRNGISVLATTNRPRSIDSALRRPGRFDRVVWMKLPDATGRAAILRRYLNPLRLDPCIELDRYATQLASMTDGASGADLEYLCQTAARICVKEMIGSGGSPDSITISQYHFEKALMSLGYITTIPDQFIPVTSIPAVQSG